MSLAQHPEPEMLSFGPGQPTRKTRGRAVVVTVIVALVVAVLAVWQLRPRPLPDFSASDLQGVFAGMVRADGQNDVATMTRDQAREAPIVVTPVGCTPLFDATTSNQFPAGAVDGVSTYWLNEGSASISLMTYRYPDQATARREYAAVDKAVTECAGRPLKLTGAGSVEAQRIPVSAIRGLPSYLSYLLSSPGKSGRFATDVFQLNNTVTWQYRYDFAAGPYTPTAARQLMDSMVSQMRSVQQSHR